MMRIGCCLLRAVRAQGAVVHVLQVGQDLVREADAGHSAWGDASTQLGVLRLRHARWRLQPPAATAAAIVMEDGDGVGWVLMLLLLQPQASAPTTPASAAAAPAAACALMRPMPAAAACLAPTLGVLLILPRLEHACWPVHLLQPPVCVAASLVGTRAAAAIAASGTRALALPATAAAKLPACRCTLGPAAAGAVHGAAASVCHHLQHCC
jgi:hypothetical protein